MKLNKKTAMFYVIAIACIIASIIFFVGPNKYLGGMWVAIGCLNIIMGSKNLKNSNDE